MFEAHKMLLTMNAYGSGIAESDSSRGAPGLQGHSPHDATRPLNALLFTNLFPSLRQRTRGLFNLRAFHALSHLCAVRVIVPVPAWRSRYWMSVPAELHHGMIATYPTYWTVPRHQVWLHARALYWSVRSHVLDLHRNCHFDVILGAFAYPDLVAAAWLASELDLPLVALVLGSDMNDLAQRPELRHQIRAALFQASRVIAVSGRLRDRVLDLGIPPEHVVVQHNGVEGECFIARDRLAARKSLAIPEDQHLVCFVGNLVPEKGPDLFIEAISQLTRSRSVDVHAAVIGAGPLRRALRSRVSSLQISDRVSFLGQLPPDQVALWMSAADALCLPSRREGCPNVVLEALASGRPVVAAAVDGVPELLSDDNGIMVPPDNPSALARGITEVLQRKWDPAALRATVPSLSWDGLGNVLYQSFVEATAQPLQWRAK